MRRVIALAGMVAAALATAVGATGCGGGSAGLDGSAVAQAAQATRSAGTAQVSMTVGVAGQALRGGGYVDLKGHAADMSLAMPQGTIREIFEGKKLYLQLPSSLRKGALANKPWAVIDVGAVAQARGIDLGALQSQSDPSQTLDQLRSVGQVHKVGTETVRGTDTTHFKAVVDLRKAAAAKGVSSQAIDTLIQQLGRSTLPIDVWLDNQKRLRRERLALSVQGQTATVTFELFNFGTSHNVTPPPAGQTVDVTKLATQQP
jgi:LppX_LprAFG lipoprotein